MKNPEQYKRLGARIRQIRKHLKLSQIEFASSIKMSNTYLSEIEKGKGKPGYEFFYSVAVKYNISIEYLFFGTGEMFGNSTEKRLMNKKADDRDFNDEIESFEDIIWLMEKSPIFERTIMSFAAKFHFDNDKLLRNDIKLQREKKIKRNNQDTGNRQES